MKHLKTVLEKIIFLQVYYTEFGFLLKVNMNVVYHEHGAGHNRDLDNFAMITRTFRNLFL